MSKTFRSPDPERFTAALRRFDAANSADPNSEIVDGVARPRERVYAERLTQWVVRLAPDASEALRLAARCQHICRWQIPRSAYPMDRAGYLKWRSELKKFHAKKSGEILREVGYPAEMVERVQELNLKQKFPHDAETRLLEDALCLVFLQYQFADLAARTAPDKVIAALQKSWAKMSPTARQEAMRLNYTEMEHRLLAIALNSGTACDQRGNPAAADRLGTNLPPKTK